MYSLYRAWLMRDAVAAASWTTPPDLMITVGNSGTEYGEETINYGCRFVAHKRLVSMHSGYLKSIIQNEEPQPMGCGLALTNVSLPNVSSESFAPLLSFMYTGYLELTNDNIYSVLLATHLLHMPRALDLCRAYLVQRQSDSIRLQAAECRSDLFTARNNTKIIKPIPSRKVRNFDQSIWSPVNMPPVVLDTRPDGPFRCVSPSEKDKMSSVIDCNAKPDSSAVPSTSGGNERSSTKRATPSSTDREENSVRAINACHTRKVNRKREGSVRRINNENLKAEYDVACCDGPIRFHRVLNESYGTEANETGSKTMRETMTEEDLEKEYLENYPKTQFFKLKSSNLSSYMHQQMINSNSFGNGKTAKGIPDSMTPEIVGNEIPPANSKSGPLESKDGGEKEDSSDLRVFACVHCKHTFKSRYCYRKHAKRHLNPVGESEETAGKKGGVATIRHVDVSNSKVEDQRKNGNGRREVRLLDMNVQYYPCKTCGSKFPSYYFVHKHRKLCHANEENYDEETSNQPIDNSDSSSSEKLNDRQIVC